MLPRHLRLPGGADAWLIFLALLGFAASSATLDAGAVPKKKKAANKKDPQFQAYLRQLQAHFKEWDRDNDQVLDKTELARAFRGPGARPFDEPPLISVVNTPSTAPKGKSAARPKVPRLAVLLTSLPQPGLPANLVAAQLLVERAATAAPPEPAVRSTIVAAPQPNVDAFGDVQFLKTLGKLKSGRITQQDFDAWARDYAQKLDRYDEALDALEAAKQRLKKGANPKARKEAQAEMQRRQNEVRQQQTQLATIPAAVRQALHVKR